MILNVKIRLLQNLSCKCCSYSPVTQIARISLGPFPWLSIPSSWCTFIICCIWYATILFIVTLLFMWLGLCEYYLQPSQVSLLNNTNLHLSWKGHIGLRHNRFQNNLDRVNLQMCARLFKCRRCKTLATRNF